MPLPPDFAAHYEAKRQAFTEARLSFMALEAEMRAHDQIAQLYGKAQPAQEPAEPPARRPHRARRDRRRNKAGNLRDKPRAILLALAAVHPRTHNAISLAEALSRAGHTTKLNTLRSALSVYVNKGFIQRVSPGVFRVTPAGAAAAGTTLRE